MNLFRNLQDLKNFKDCRVAILMKIDSRSVVVFDSLVGKDPNDEQEDDDRNEFKFISIFLMTNGFWNILKLN